MQVFFFHNFIKFMSYIVTARFMMFSIFFIIKINIGTSPAKISMFGKKCVQGTIV
jgi:hypothetical protein